MLYVHETAFVSFSTSVLFTGRRLDGLQCVVQSVALVLACYNPLFVNICKVVAQCQHKV